MEKIFCVTAPLTALTQFYPFSFFHQFVPVFAHGPRFNLFSPNFTHFTHFQPFATCFHPISPILPIFNLLQHFHSFYLFLPVLPSSTVFTHFYPFSLVCHHFSSIFISIGDAIRALQEFLYLPHYGFLD